MVTATNSRGAGPVQGPHTFVTPEDAPSGPVQGLTCQAATSTAIRIAWEKPRRRERNGNILGYSVTLASVDGEFSALILV